jgi:hypothetical protein
MGIIIFIVIPACWAMTARLMAMAVALSVPGERGNRMEVLLRRWGAWVFPAVYLLLMFLGLSGDAGRGAFLFGSQELFEVAAVAWYLVPVLCVYVALTVVIRDVARGLRSWAGKRD